MICPAQNPTISPVALHFLPGFWLVVPFRQKSGPEPMTEPRELIERIVARDESALDELYERFSGALFAVILRIVKSREDADEILCGVFLQVWNKADSYDLARGATYTWLLSLARNRAIDRIRSKAWKNGTRNENDPVEWDGMVNESAENPLEAVVLSERAATVRATLREIPAEQREILEIAYFEGYTQSQIAERMNLPLGTVKTRMRDGMKRLQGLLKGRVEWP
jgi:RNA polymerase sigma-70 factor (ECF subfamily)